MNELITDKYVFFWNGYLSQWYPSPFVSKNGSHYNCCEQYMMAKKALLFEDTITHSKIMNTDDPSKQKKLGRQVKNFDKNTWNKYSRRIVYKANYYKFTQNKDLQKKLLKTGDKLIVEASPYDFVWGIGMSAKKAQYTPKEQWKGTNWLGLEITNVRETIKKELSSQ